jgi:hypothetical protein
MVGPEKELSLLWKISSTTQTTTTQRPLPLVWDCQCVIVLIPPLPPHTLLSAGEKTFCMI